MNLPRTIAIWIIATCILAMIGLAYEPNRGPHMALGTLTIELSTNPIEMPGDWDSSQPVDILITSCGGIGESSPGAGAGGRGAGGGGFARWNGVTITNPAACSVEIIPNDLGVGHTLFSNETGQVRRVLNGLTGIAGGIGGYEDQSDFAPTIGNSGGNGAAGLPNGSGGGGGGAAGEAANGGNGTTANGGGAGGAGGGGDAGAGGNGGTDFGSDGEFYGGGGGGAFGAGGFSADGVVKIIYTIRLDAPLDPNMRGNLSDMRGGFEN